MDRPNDPAPAGSLRVVRREVEAPLLTNLVGCERIWTQRMTVVCVVVAKHLRRRRGGSSEEATTYPRGQPSREDPVIPDDVFLDHGPSDPGRFVTGRFEEEAFGGDAVKAESFRPEAVTDEDWFGPSRADDDSYAARRDVSLASMLMLGGSPYQRIDGMGLARKALETPPTGDPRRDISEEERSLLGNARAWCLLVHGDLGHRSRLDDPFVLADAERFVEAARGMAPGNPNIETTMALLRLRQDRMEDALESAEHALEVFASIPEHQRNGRTQGAATLAVVTRALVAASSGDLHGARVLSAAARAVVTPLDLDEAAFTALLAELDRTIAGSA